jgi:hypothetical protein
MYGNILQLTRDGLPFSWRLKMGTEIPKEMSPWFRSVLSLSTRSGPVLMPMKPAKAQDQPCLKRPFSQIASF